MANDGRARQIADLEAKIERLHAHHERQVSILTQKNAKLSANLSALQQKRGDIALLNTTAEMETEREARRIAERDRDMAWAAVHAGLARREAMLLTLGALLYAEDSPDLSDDVYDALMGRVIAQARTLVSLERLAREAAPPEDEEAA